MLFKTLGPGLQPLGQHPNPGAIKANNFDPRVPPIAEHKQRALLEVFAQPLRHQRVQPIEPLTHVAGFHRHEHFQAARKT